MGAEQHTLSLSIGARESALARAVVKLASTLRLEAVAEGISTRKQLLQLRRLRCPYGQGFFFSRPQAAAAIPGKELLPELERMRRRTL